MLKFLKNIFRVKSEPWKVKDQYTTRLKEPVLTNLEIQVLMHLDQHPGVTRVQIRTELDQPDEYVEAAMENLEKYGYLEYKES